MVSIHDVPASELIAKLASELKKKGEMKAPEWASYVKTGAHKERPPKEEDWWHIRSAAVLRTIYKDGPVGVSKLCSKYGGRKNRGVKRHRFYKGSGKVIRTILQQLDAAGLTKKIEKGKGRQITPAGQSLLDQCAKKVAPKKDGKVEKPKEVKPKLEVKEKKSKKKEVEIKEKKSKANLKKEKSKEVKK